MERRELFKILTTGAAGLEVSAQHTHEVQKAPEAQGPAKFFSRAEQSTVDALADIIIPSDELSPGAHEARVWRYIDLVLYYGSSAQQAEFRSGSAVIDAVAKRQFGAPFHSLTRARQTRIVALAAAKEDDARDELGRFFRVIKTMTIAGFHCTEICREKFMGYRGNAAVSEFTGCSHPEHRKFEA
jgi:hypothetical protein